VTTTDAKVSKMPRRINLFVRIVKTGFRCWKFDENANRGEPLWDEIDMAIKDYDELAL
jgi:hypothetical protein